ncbi:MAG TPA: hypothetical protein VN887_11030 [Candidatus Angelobacter sp.]|nr:hypothetical protein [Candidatus Angelobacter sp.]
MAKMPIGWTKRCSGTACYLGFYPLLRLWRGPVTDAFVALHCARAMAAGFVALAWLLVDALFEASEMFLLICFPDFARPFIEHWEPYLTYALLLPLIVLVGLWMASLGLALAGSTRPIPVLKRVARWPGAVHLSYAANSLVLALLPIIVLLVVHATSLTRTSGDGAAVYFLYDEGIPVPRWGYAVGLYRISLEAKQRWGKGSIVLDRLDKQTLRAALAHGKVLILATHGGDGYACAYYSAEKLGVGPPDIGATDTGQNFRFLRMCIFGADNKPGAWEDVSVNHGMRLVYLFGCNAGMKAAEWEEHLAPAQVVTYKRESTVFDHGLWFACVGPAQVKQLK